jgi:hypothetical protein
MLTTWWLNLNDFENLREIFTVNLFEGCDHLANRRAVPYPHGGRATKDP